jgi:hypothetical protein
MSFSIFGYFRVPTVHVLLNSKLKFNIFWFKYLYLNSMVFCFIICLLFFFLLKGFRKLLFIDLGAVGNPDYLWTAFRRKRIDEVD